VAVTLVKEVVRVTIKWIGIAKLQEEMGELQAVLGKLHAYPDGQHPDMRYSAPLTHRLQEELADVIAACQFSSK
jgi:NTP pyrophosphatase (non-canonical NTP hydrolase)